MPRRQAPFITKLLAEGSARDRENIRDEEMKAANMLVISCPRESVGRIMYIRARTIEALSGKLDLKVFAMFVNRVNAFEELQTMLPRVQMEVNRTRQKK